MSKYSFTGGISGLHGEVEFTERGSREEDDDGFRWAPGVPLLSREWPYFYLGCSFEDDFLTLSLDGHHIPADEDDDEKAAAAADAPSKDDAIKAFHVSLDVTLSLADAKRLHAFLGQIVDMVESAG
jgi:hypothetical protein